MNMDELFSTKMRAGPPVSSPNDPASSSSPMDKLLSSMKEGPDVTTRAAEDVVCTTTSTSVNQNNYSIEMNAILSNIKDAESDEDGDDATIVADGDQEDDEEFEYEYVEMPAGGEGEEITNRDIANTNPDNSADPADILLGTAIHRTLGDLGVMGSSAGYKKEPKAADRILASVEKQRQQMEEYEKVDPEGHKKKLGSNKNPPKACAIYCFETNKLIAKAGCIKGDKEGRKDSSTEDTLYKLIGGNNDTVKNVPFIIPVSIKVDDKNQRTHISVEWITLCLEKNHPIRYKFKVVLVNDKEYAELDEISKEGKVLFRKLKAESDDMFHTGRPTTGKIDVYTVTESDTASEGSIECGGRHYSKGGKCVAHYKSLTRYGIDGYKVGHYKTWKPQVGRPAGYKKYAPYGKPTRTLMDAVCYKDGVLWKGTDSTFYWLVNA